MVTDARGKELNIGDLVAVVNSAAYRTCDYAKISAIGAPKQSGNKITHKLTFENRKLVRNNNHVLRLDQ